MTNVHWVDMFVPFGISAAHTARRGPARSPLTALRVFCVCCPSLVVVLYLGASIAVGPLFSARAGKSTSSFFLGGRSLPWYLSGTSMVATTFSAGTPLLISA